MAKKIEGFVDGTGEGPEFMPYKEGNQYFPFWEAQGITLKPKFGYWRRAVVVVTEERVFTESEVRAMFLDLIEDQARCDVHNGWQSGVIPDFAGIATKHGVSLDPA